MPTASVKVLGAMMGDENVHRDFFDRMVSKVSSLHESIDSTSDPAVELTLKRKCADVSKAVYTLRANGDRIPMATLTSYDDMLRASLGRTLGGEVGEDSWEQAATGIFCGGLGFRRASDVALPAFVASRNTSWPAVKSIFQDLHDAGLVDYEQLRTAYHARTSNAQCAFEASLDVDVLDHVRSKIMEASDKAVALWADISTGAARSTSGNASTLTPGGSMVDAVGA